MMLGDIHRCTTCSAMLHFGNTAPLCILCVMCCAHIFSVSQSFHLQRECCIINTWGMCTVHLSLLFRPHIKPQLVSTSLNSKIFHVSSLQLWFTPLHAAASQAQTDVLMEMAMHLYKIHLESNLARSRQSMSHSLRESQNKLKMTADALTSSFNRSASGQGSSSSQLEPGDGTEHTQKMQAGDSSKSNSKSWSVVREKSNKIVPTQAKTSSAPLVEPTSKSLTHASNPQVEADVEVYRSMWFAKEVHHFHVWRVLRDSLQRPEQLDVMLYTVVTDQEQALAFGVSDMH